MSRSVSSMDPIFLNAVMNASWKASGKKDAQDSRTHKIAHTLLRTLSFLHGRTPRACNIFVANPRLHFAIHSKRFCELSRKLNEIHPEYLSSAYGISWLLIFRTTRKFIFIIILDINECWDGYPCHKNAECINTRGSFTCECMKGFEGDGLDNCKSITLFDIIWAV